MRKILFFIIFFFFLINYSSAEDISLINSTRIIKIPGKIYKMTGDFRFAYLWIDDYLYLYEGGHLTRIKGIEGIKTLDKLGRFISLIDNSGIKVVSYKKIIRSLDFSNVFTFNDEIYDGFILKNHSKILSAAENSGNALPYRKLYISKDSTLKYCRYIDCIINEKPVPIFSTDENYFYYVANYMATPKLMEFNVNSLSKHLFSTVRLHIGEMALSPDDSLIIFNNKVNNFKIGRIRISDKNIRYFKKIYGRFITVSPDSNFFLFLSESGESYDLYISDMYGNKKLIERNVEGISPQFIGKEKILCVKKKKYTDYLLEIKL